MGIIQHLSRPKRRVFKELNCARKFWGESKNAKVPGTYSNLRVEGYRKRLLAMLKK
jgi:hypothetical protein